MTIFTLSENTGYRTRENNINNYPKLNCHRQYTRVI